VISEEKMRAISEALSTGTSKAAVCRTFNVKRTTLYDALGKTEIPMADLVPS